MDYRANYGYRATIKKLKTKIAELQKENSKLKKDMGILEETGFLERPSLPLIIVGAGFRGRPVCEVHGAMLRYDRDIWRCEECKTAVDLSESLKWIREEFDGIVVIK